jgi:hypothetical protein
MRQNQATIILAFRQGKRRFYARRLMIIFVQMRKSIFIRGFLLLCIGAALVAFLWGRYEQCRIKKFPIKYAFTPRASEKNPVLYIERLKYKEPYMNVVNLLQDSTQTRAPINFPIISLAPGQKIYIRRFLSDSILVEFYDPDRAKPFSLRTGYMAKIFIHDSPVKE